MKTIRYLTFLLSIANCLASNAQVTGTVYERNEKGELAPLPFVNLHWLGSKTARSSDANGKFSIAFPQAPPFKLIFSMINYRNDTAEFANTTAMNLKVIMRSNDTLQQVDIIEKKDATYISYSPLKIETITQKEIKTMACCNLGESFERNATVDVTYKDAVTGSKEIQILGLSGSYTLMLTENMPLMVGLSQTYGLSSIPGNQLSAINIVKGPGSVIFGHDAMAGMVNVELKDPMNTHRFFVNAYLDNDLRKELNIDKAWKVNEKLSTLLMIHGDHASLQRDRNEDSFMDMPMLSNVNVTSKWKYLDGKGRISQLTLKYLWEDRMGGQTGFHFGEHHPDTTAYGQRLTSNMFEMNGRAGFAFKSKKYSSFGVQYSGFYHDQYGFYGIRHYAGTELNGNIRAIYNTEWSEHNSLNAGLTFRYDDTQETFDTLSLIRTESVPGVFLENTFNKDHIVALITGVRADLYENKVYLTPRVNFKYSFTENIDLRLSAGTGWKTPYLLAENPNVLVSSKSIVINGTILPQESFNFGVNYVHKFKWFYRKGSLVLDAYQTRFRNMVIPNYDFDFTKVIFENWDGKAISNSLQAEFTWEVMKNLDLKLAWKFLDVYKVKDGFREQLPFIAKQRALATLFYETFNRKWNMAFTTQWFGEKRMPYTLFNPLPYRRDLYSDPYFKLNVQVNRVWKRHEIYLGSENLLNFIQEDAIISADNPYGPYFDTSFIWGPLEGRKIYVGWRFHLE